MRPTQPNDNHALWEKQSRSHNIVGVWSGANLELNLELKPKVLHGEALLRTNLLQHCIVQPHCRAACCIICGDDRVGTYGRVGRWDTGAADLRPQHAHRFFQFLVPFLGSLRCDHLRDSSPSRFLPFFTPSLPTLPLDTPKQFSKHAFHFPAPPNSRALMFRDRAIHIRFL